MKTADINRRLESLIRLGTIAQVDHAARRLRVKTGDLLTGWLPWPAEVGRNFRRWRPLREGAQVVLACPSGDPAQAAIIGMLYTQSLDRPSADPDVDLIEFEDGTRLEYNSHSHHLNAECVGDVTIVSPTHVTIDCPDSTLTGKLTVNNNIRCNAKITAAGDVIAVDSVSLATHKHTGDDGGLTSAPL
ncbi:phage baseplate assembly protein V [Marinobacterium stanieri]|nr:phage baseplate assembly protein V [Marinobacterium stanieri]